LAVLKNSHIFLNELAMHKYLGLNSDVTAWTNRISDKRVRVWNSMEQSIRTIQHQNKGSWSFQSRYSSRIPFSACIRSSSWNEM